MRARHRIAPAPLVRERERLKGGLKPGARELFPLLRDRLLASRPVIAVDDQGRKAYGPPTFRNVIADGRVI